MSADAAGSPSTARPEMTLNEAEDWWIFWETLGSRSRPDDMEEREAARVLHAEYDRLRALAGEAEPTADVPPVWWSPEYGLIERVILPGTGERYARTRERDVLSALPADAVRLVPAGGPAPADEDERLDDVQGWLHEQNELTDGPMYARTLGLVQDQAAEVGRMRPVVEAAEAWATARSEDARMTSSSVIPTAQVLLDRLAAYRAGGSAPHQGATTDAEPGPTWDAYRAADRALAKWHERRHALLARLDAIESNDTFRRIMSGYLPSTISTAEVRALLGAGETTEETHG